MAFDDVDELDRVVLLGQPGGVDARTATDVEHRRGRRWQLAPQQLADAQQLQATVWRDQQTLRLVVLLGVEPHQRIVHVASLAHHASETIPDRTQHAR